MKKIKIYCLILLATCIVFLASCSSSNAKKDNQQSVKIIYTLRIPNYLKENDKFIYKKGTRERNIIEKFIKEKSLKRINKIKDTYIEVVLMPPEYAQLCQRPVDLIIVGANLEVFVNCIEDGEMPYLPDFKEKIPIEKIEQDLIILAKNLNVDKPKIRRSGVIWGRE